MRLFSAFICLVISLNASGFDYSNSNRIFIGGKAFYRDYSEVLVSPKKSDEYGALYGINLGYQHKVPNAFLFEFDIDLDFGTTTYDGSLQDWDGSYRGAWKDKTNNLFLNFDSKLGYAFLLNQYHLLTPFLGYGIHFWGRGLSGETETYAIEYGTLGFQYDYIACAKWQYGLHIKLMPMLHGNMATEYTSPDFMNLGNELHFEISAPIVYKKLNSKNHLRFTPYYKNQRFGASNNVRTYHPLIMVHEPASQTHIIGLKIDYGFGF